MTVDPADSSYMPSLVVVSGGLKLFIKFPNMLILLGPLLFVVAIYLLALQTTDLAQTIDIYASQFLHRWKLFEQLD